MGAARKGEAEDGPPGFVVERGSRKGVMQTYPPLTD
jgi:hypothetical protein